jgi:hypothetical protein
MSTTQCLQRYGRISVWVGILSDQFLGTKRVTGAVCHLLVNDLPLLSGYVPPHHRQHVRFTQDRSPRCLTEPDSDFR